MLFCKNIVWKCIQIKGNILSWKTFNNIHLYILKYISEDIQHKYIFPVACKIRSVFGKNLSLYWACRVKITHSWKCKIRSVQNVETSKKKPWRLSSIQLRSKCKLFKKNEKTQKKKLRSYFFKHLNCPQGFKAWGK